MKLGTDTNILIVGLGLMGGSYAKALKKQGFHINAITKEQKDADYAVSEGIVDRAIAYVDEKTVADADLVIFALYPHIFIEWIESYQHLFKSGTVITDITGVKGCIVDKVQSMLREDVEFIAAHPMAGRERSGVENSDDSVFHGANYIVVPTEKNTPEAIELCFELGRQLGFSHLSELTPKAHDEMIAYLSQLTHCIAVCLMTSNQTEGLEDYTGDSFRDLTRIANINEVMWTELFLLNKDALLASMQAFVKDFEKLMDMIKNDNVEGMYEMMRTSTERRKLFNKKH